MDAKFLPAMTAIKHGRASVLAKLIESFPGLATSSSSCSHPNLMQCLVLDGKDLESETQLDMARCLRAAGSEIDGPLIAASSVGNLVLGRYLIDEGAAIDGRADLLGGWSPLEEALYWGHDDMVRLLLERGASVRNLRCAAGLGRLDIVSAFFDADETLNVERAGAINSPFMSFHNDHHSTDPQDVLDNALVYAAAAGESATVELLLERGARVNAIPPGFDFRGTPLHYAAMRGERVVCEQLLAHGADPEMLDPKVEQTPAGWARHGGHEDLARQLESAEG